MTINLQIQRKFPGGWELFTGVIVPIISVVIFPLLAAARELNRRPDASGGALVNFEGPSPAGFDISIASFYADSLYGVIFGALIALVAWGSLTSAASRIWRLSSLGLGLAISIVGLLVTVNMAGKLSGFYRGTAIPVLGVIVGLYLLIAILVAVKDQRRIRRD